MRNSCRLFTKYQVFIYPECAGECCVFHLQRIVPRLLFAVLVGLVLCSGYLLIKTFEIESKQQRFAALEVERLTLRTGLLSEARKLAEIRSQYDRVDDFNNKLKVMLNMAKDDEAAAALGGSGLVFAQASITPYNMRSLVRNMQRGTNSLSSDIMDAERVQQAVLRKMRHSKSILAWTPSVWPVKGRITSGFGRRNHPFDKKFRMHQGIDIVPPTGRGTPIHAPANGVVIFVGRKGYYGLIMKIRHYDDIVTKYAHLSKAAAKVGQIVSRDDVIAFVGNTGRSTGPHLHYEVLVGGSAKNPRRYILN